MSLPWTSPQANSFGHSARTKVLLPSMYGQQTGAKTIFAALKETKSFPHQLSSRIQTRDSITSLWLTILNYIFPLDQGYSISLRTKGGGETTAVLDVYAWVRGNAAVPAHFKAILQIVMIEQAVSEQPGGSRVPTRNNFDRVFFGDGGAQVRPERLEVPMICTTGVDILVEGDDDTASKEKSTKKGGVESSLKGGGKRDKWISLRELEGENWASRFFETVK